MDEQKEVVLTNDLLLAVPCYQEDVLVILKATINLDLSEFELTPEEIYKFRKIMQQLNYSLSDAFSKSCLAASVTTEIQPKTKSAKLAA